MFGLLGTARHTKEVSLFRKILDKPKIEIKIFKFPQGYSWSEPETGMVKFSARSVGVNCGKNKN